MNGSGKQSFYEIQLSNSSLIVAFVIAVGIGVAVFMLGVMVGRGQAPAVAGSDLVEPFAAAEQAPVEEQQASSDLQFDDSVRESTSDTPAGGDPGTQAPESAMPAATEPGGQAPAPQLPAHDPSIATGFVVQVRATDDRGEADALQAALAGAGFPAFVVTGDNIYRVRVGRYRTQSDAERVAVLLSERSDVNETWITQG